MFRKKLPSNESVINDSILEQKGLICCHNDFTTYFKHTDKIHQNRQEDCCIRHNEKIHQLEEYVDLQAKVDQVRQVFYQSREVVRRRCLEIERQRLQELVAQQQKLMDKEKV